MTTANLDLITAFANLAREPHALPTPAVSEADVLRPLRRLAQLRLNVEGLPRGLGKVA